MRKFISVIGAILLIAAGQTDSWAAQNGNQSAAQNIQLTIKSDKDVVKSGSTITLSAQMKNLSADGVGVDLYNGPPIPYLDVELVNAASQSFRISQKITLVTFVRPPLTLHPGETQKWDIPLTITEKHGKAIVPESPIVPGDYTMKATQGFYLGYNKPIDMNPKKYIGITSNLVKLKVE